MVRQSHPSYAGLPWLADAPAEARRLMREAKPPADDFLAKAARLSHFYLDVNQLTALSRRLRKHYDLAGFPDSCSSAKVAVLSNATVNLAMELLPISALRHGVAASTLCIEYEAASTAAMAPEPRVEKFAPDFILLAYDHFAFPIDDPRADSEGKASSEAQEFLSMLLEGLERNYGVPVILQTFATPPESLFGSFDLHARGSWRNVIIGLNDYVLRTARDKGDLLLDVANLVERVGSERWFDREQWFAHKLPFHLDMSPLYCELLGRLLGAARGRSRKCLVLDLDNTIWGGVIGDDGLEGIVLGQGSAEGEAYLDFQRYVLDLRARGIVLAVCSKNDDDTARLPFRKHPEMLLKEEHFAVFQANWKGKPENLEAIAGSLRIGLDALVFFDDNPTERAQVRQALPSVAVPEAGSDPTWYTWILSSAGYFEAVSFSEEDKLRPQAYGAEAKRVAVMNSARDQASYLAFLEMEISFAPFDDIGRGRITQLINKTNQFNLTTRRYAEVEVASMQRSDAYYTLQVRLRDRFGDSGMIGVIIAKQLEEEECAWEIDTWLMSCRVLGRQVERAMLQEVLREALKRNICRILGRYVPTAKNSLVSDHYENLGFELLERDADGSSLWLLECSRFSQVHLPFREIGDYGPAAAE